MKKTILFLFFLTAISYQLTAPVSAAPVTKTSGNIEITYDDPLFPPSVVWSPGLSQTGSLTVKNLDTATHAVAIEATNTSQTGGIAGVYNLLVSQGANALYGNPTKTLQNFWDDGQISLSNLASGSSTTYDLTVSMLPSAGNPYQGKEATFDLLVGFVGTPNQVTVTTTNSGPPTCTDTAPQGAPTLLRAIVGANSVTLFWSKAVDPVSYYLVAYGPTPGNYLYGNPNVGGKDTTSYTVNNLSGGVPYYFVVRAGNGCTPGPFSNELSTIPTGPVVAGIGAGFAPGVLGATAPSSTATPAPTPSSTPAPTILGAVAPFTASTCSSCLPLKAFIALIPAAILSLFLKHHQVRTSKNLAISSILFALVFLTILGLTLCSPTWLCYLSLILSLLLVAGIFFILKKSSSVTQDIPYLPGNLQV